MMLNSHPETVRYGRRPVLFLFLLTGILAVHSFAIPASPSDPVSIVSSRGMQVKVIKAPQMQFYHAELVIFYRGEPENPAIPMITLMNLLHPDVNKGDSPLLELLDRLGNDMSIDSFPDFLVLKFNFLPDKFPIFMKFVKGLFSYKPLISSNLNVDKYYKKSRSTLDRFYDSINNFWKYFRKSKDWKQKLASEIAYHHFFFPNKLGKSLITSRAVKSVTLEQVRAFYRNIYQVPNSMLIVKGNISNPYVLNGTVEMELGSFRKLPPQVDTADDSRPPLSSKRKIIIFDTGDKEPPVLYWYEAVPFTGKSNWFLEVVCNNLLFLQPLGRVYSSAINSSLGHIRMDTETVTQKNVLFICNTVQLNYKDIEPFINIVEKEKKKMKINRVERQEFTKATGYIHGRLKVNTTDFENDVGKAIIRTPFPSTPDSQKPQFNMAALSEVIDETDRTAIIIVGNNDLIQASLNLLKRQVEVFRFN